MRAAVQQVGADLNADNFAYPADIGNDVSGSPNPAIAGALAADLTLGSAALQHSAQVRRPALQCDLICMRVVEHLP